ncbi:MAG: translation initiation factor IF-1 [Ignavibacteriaceae bacterium]|nr:translation initiation factor IF-1 [Ignavibacteriaceae bacterium]
MKTQKQDNDKTIEVEGTVVAALPKLEYKVEIDFKGIKHTLTCHVSGKMKTRFINLELGDKVLIRISLYDIDRGIIFRRLTSRQKPVFSEVNKG